MIQRRIAECVALLAFAAACGDSGIASDPRVMLAGSFALWQIDGTSLPIAERRLVGPDSTSPSCTDYLAAMRIDVTSSTSAQRSESHRFTCTNGVDRLETVVESGTVSTVADSVRFEFQETGLYLTTRYIGRLDGSTLIIVRRETHSTGYLSGQVYPPLTVNPSRLVFRRL